jgi:sterol desaturase/sphingolipid hydroxylase (fatty acid hydroxylase superfamily)
MIVVCFTVLLLEIVKRVKVGHLMQTVVDFFSNYESWQRASLLIGGLMFFWLVEGLLPNFPHPRKRGNHAGLNLFFYATTVVINTGLAVMILWVSDWTQGSGFGLLQWVSLPLWATALVGLLLLDLIGAWLIHFLQHKIKVLWRFHLIHHTDTHIDVTTALRHHPVESLFRVTFTILGVLIVGAPMWLVMLYQFLSALFSQFNHANFSLPAWLDRPLSWVFVTPDFHKVHHHYVQPYTDTNYGNIFSFWDRLTGQVGHLAKSELVYGIETHPARHEHNSIKSLLVMPFKAYRSPQGADSTKPETLD